jgi:hypothetical protein
VELVDLSLIALFSRKAIEFCRMNQARPEVTLSFRMAFFDRREIDCSITSEIPPNSTVRRQTPPKISQLISGDPGQTGFG